MPKRLTKESFIDKAKIKHGDKYDYSKVKYVNNRTSIIIICDIHGAFSQLASSHLAGKGCYKCGFLNKKKSQPCTQKEFISKCRKKHGNRYIYDKVNYKSSSNGVMITCRIHGDFKQTPNSHLQGRGCPKCGLITRARKRSLNNRETFVRKCEEIHPLYDFSETIFKHSNIKVQYRCPKHGIHSVYPYSLLQGHGCPKCASWERGELFRASFLDKVTKLHPDLDFSNTETPRSNYKLTCKCPKHGFLKQNLIPF